MELGKQRIKCPGCGTVLAVNVKEENITKNLKCPVCKNVTPLVQYHFIEMLECVAGSQQNVNVQPAPAPAPAEEISMPADELFPESPSIGDLTQEKEPADEKAGQEQCEEDVAPTVLPDQYQIPQVKEEEMCPYNHYNGETEIFDQYKTQYRESENDIDSDRTVIATVGRLIVKDNKSISYQLKVGENIVGRNGEGSEADFKLDTPNEKKISREHIIVDVKSEGNDYSYSVRLYKKEVNRTYVNGNRIEYSDCIRLHDKDTITLPGLTLQLVL